MRNFFYTIYILLLTINVFSQTPNGPGGVGTINELQIWLDATKISASNGDFLSSWGDVSGNSNDFTQSNPTYQPTFSDNSSINSGACCLI